MSGRDEEPIKDFPECKICKRRGKRFSYWRYDSPEGLEKNIYFNPGVEMSKKTRYFSRRVFAVPIYDNPKGGGRMCTLEELKAARDGTIVCYGCKLEPSPDRKAGIIRVARRKIIEYEEMK